MGDYLKFTEAHISRPIPDGVGILLELVPTPKAETTLFGYCI